MGSMAELSQPLTLHPPRIVIYETRRQCHATCFIEELMYETVIAQRT